MYSFDFVVVDQINTYLVFDYLIIVAISFIDNDRLNGGKFNHYLAKLVVAIVPSILD